MCEQTKKCSKCGEVRARTGFHKDRQKKDGLKSACKVCRNAARAKHYKDNSTEILSRIYEYRKANPEVVKARSKAYYKANSDAIKARVRKWCNDNPVKSKVIKQRRRALELNAKGDHTAEQLRARFDYHGNKCVYCDSTENLHADHQIPLSRGGTNFASNMVPACATCNISKGSKTPIEFADYTFKQLQAMLGK